MLCQSDKVSSSVELATKCTDMSHDDALNNIAVSVIIRNSIHSQFSSPPSSQGQCLHLELV